MTYERNGLLLPPRSEPAIDEQVFESFEATGASTQETYTDLSISEARKKELEREFLESGCTIDVDLSAQHLDEAVLTERFTRLDNWKTELLANESIDPDIKQAYLWRINEDIANAQMLIASRDHNTEQFRRLNSFIYGEPDEAIYRGALDWVCAEAEQLATSEQPQVAEAAQNVLGLIGDKRGYRELLAPEPEVFEAVRQDHYRERGYYALLLAGVELPKEGKVTPGIGDPALRHIVRNNLQSDYQITDAAGSTWGVSHKDETVKRPKTYNMPVRRFIGLGAGHEIGSHLLEKVNGSRGPVNLAQVGLDRTESGNEGRAVIREQVPYETFDEFGKLIRWQDILRREITIAFAEGVGEERPQTFAEVYRLVNAIDTMYQVKKTPEDPEATREKAHTRTWNLLTRALKGTDGTGGAYLKDKVYLEGHVASWLTAAMRGPEAISEGDLGKFDINNPRHITFLQRRHLLPVR